MIDAMRDSYESVRSTLSRYTISTADTWVILETVKGLCYRWAEANAVGCLEDETLRERLSTAENNSAISDFERNARFIHEKILATFPPEWVEEDEETDTAQTPAPEEPADITHEEELYE